MRKPGELLSDRYKVERVLGEGGMGAVYLVSDTRLPRQWAVKEMSDKFTEADQLAEAERSFKDEANILSALTHNNLPRIVDAFNQEGRHYLVMDYIEGTTLEARLDGGKTLAVPEALDLALQITEVFEYLHTQPKPVIFRDLKPGNIILTPTGTAKLVDFGIARVFRPDASTDTRALGTPGYAAPEQYGKGQSDERTDIYALGATLYQALSGKDPTLNPFQFPPFRESRKEVPEALEKVILKAVSLKPEERYRTAREFREALEALKQDRETYQHLPARLRTAPLQAPLSEGFDPPVVRFGQLGQRQQAKVEVIVRGEANLKLKSDARWLQVRPAKVKGTDQVIGLYADTSRLPDGGSFAATVSASGTPTIQPLRVEVEVTAPKLPRWALPVGGVLCLGSTMPILGFFLTCGLFMLLLSAPRTQRRGLQVMLAISSLVTLFYLTVGALMVFGLYHIDGVQAWLQSLWSAAPAPAVTP